MALVVEVTSGVAVLNCLAGKVGVQYPHCRRVAFRGERAFLANHLLANHLLAKADFLTTDQGRNQERTPMLPVFRLCSVVAVISSAAFLVPACGGGEGGPGGAAGSNALPNPDTDINVGSGGPAPSSGTQCMKNSDCEGQEICHPVGKVCTAGGKSCSDNGACPGGTYCDAGTGTCLEGLAGSPCDSNDNCTTGSTCIGDVCGCSGFQLEQETSAGPLDIYFIFDRTASMGTDCDYVAGDTATENSKACFATYAMSDYVTQVSPQVDTRLAFQFMSYDNGCDGTPYSTPLVPLTKLPVGVDHQIVTEISNEDFSGGSGTQIEGALIGISNFTSQNETPGREMIGVLMTDGDPNGCDQNIDNLAQIIADHLAQTGIRTFIIGMDGATEENLETLAVAGGAEPHDDFCGALAAPCHYWNVGDGSGAAIADALNAIVGQAVEFPCDFPLSEIRPTDGSELDTATLNIQLSQGGVATVISNVESESACPSDQPAWYYDDNAAPSSLILCQNACDLVSAADKGAKMTVVGGCTETVVLR